MYEICNLMRRSTSRSFIFDATVTLRVAVKNGRKTTIICMFSFVTQRISFISQPESRMRFYAKIAYFIHRLIRGAANIQLLSWSERCGCRGMAGGPSVDAGPSTDGLATKEKPHLIGDQKKALNIPPLYRIIEIHYISDRK